METQVGINNTYFKFVNMNIYSFLKLINLSFSDISDLDNKIRKTMEDKSVYKKDTQ
jgi:hypothetical protein